MAFWARPPREREAAFALLRAERPLAFFEEPDFAGSSSLALPRGPGYYAATRHAEVTEISRHPEIYCSGRGALSIIDLPEEMLAYFAGMIATDNPRHARLRRIVSKAFSPRQIRAVEDTIEEAADRLIDRAAPLGGCDFVTAFAAPLSLEIICDMMGLPASEHDTVFRCSNLITSSDDAEYLAAGERPARRHARGRPGAHGPHVRPRRLPRRAPHRRPDDGAHLHQHRRRGTLQAELASFFILLLTAGNETTRNSLAHGLLALYRAPRPAGALAGRSRTRWPPPAWTRSSAGPVRSTGCAGRSPRTRCSPGSQLSRRGQGAPLLRVGQPRRGRVRRPLHVRRPALAQPPSRIRRRRAPLLPRRPPGPPGDRRDAAPAAHPLPDIEACGEPDRAVSRFVNGIKHLPCRFTPA